MSAAESPLSVITEAGTTKVLSGGALVFSVAPDGRVTIGPAFAATDIKAALRAVAARQEAEASNER